MASSKPYALLHALPWGVLLVSAGLCACAASRQPEQVDAAQASPAAVDAATAAEAQVDAPVEDAGARATPASGTMVGDAATSGAAGVAPRDASTTPTGLDGGVAQYDAAAPLASEDCPGELTLEVTTKPSATARYEPRNVLAVWVVDASHQPVTVLALFTVVNLRALTTFNELVMQHDGLLTDTYPHAPQDPDAITMATQRAHGTHTIPWNLTDAQGAVVPDGDYTLMIETADDWSGSSVAEVTFHKSPDPVLIERPETDRFGPIELVYTGTTPGMLCVR